MDRAIISKNITSYDVLKTMAVLIMVIDHIGHYFFPDILWIRVIGRLCVPMWFFLVGYARSRDLSLRIWGGALVLALANIAAGMALFPLSILATIYMVRLCLDWVILRFEKSVLWRNAMIFVLLLLVIPTGALTEYGSSVMVLSMYGYYVRALSEGRVTKDFVKGFMIFALMFFLITQQIFFGFTTPQFTVLGIGLFAVMLLMLFFRPVELPELGSKITLAGRGLLRLCGRYSLEIYVLHLIIFKAMALALGYEGFELFGIRLFSDNVLEIFGSGLS